MLSDDRKEGRRIDPDDWGAFRGAAHDMLDAALDRLEHARDLPWIAPPGDMRARLSLAGAQVGCDLQTLMARIRDEIMPYATGNTHPRFWGWVHGTGSAIGMVAEMVAAGLNANSGGRDHGAMRIEAAVIDWLCAQAGLPQSAFGLLTTGTSQATVSALHAARHAHFGADLRARGIAGRERVAFYASDGVHSAIPRALELLGHGSDALRLIPSKQGGMSLEKLEKAISTDRKAGIRPLAVIATAGSVNTGTFDPLPQLGALTRREGLWLHVDAAFGFWTRLAEPPWRALSDGLETADSIALDLHKWVGVPYSVGACLVRDGADLRAAFATRPDYLAPASSGLAGGAPWFTDYGMDLSRPDRALKVWAHVMATGTRAIGAAITDNCRQAALMGRLIEKSPHLRLAHPVVSNVVCFSPEKGDSVQITAELQLAGEAVFSTTRLNGETCLRAAIVNHRTTSADIRAAMAAVERHVTAAQ